VESNAVTAIVLPAALFLIMFGLGLALRVADFRRVVTFPKAVAVGLSVQLIALPVIGYALAVAFRMPPELAVGLMILAACPGGATSNLITFLAKGDTALSVTLTAITSCAAVLTIPLILRFALNAFTGDDVAVGVPFAQTVGQVVIVTLIPVSIGMLVHARLPDLAKRAVGPVKVLSAAFLVLIVAGLILSQRDDIPRFFAQTGAATLALNLSTLILGFGAATLARLPYDQRVTVSIEGGLQNGTLAIAIAASPAILNNPTMAIPPAIYSLVMFATGALCIAIFPRIGARRDRAA